MPNFQQHLFIENFNLLADELRAIGIKVKTLEKEGTCLGDSYQYAFFAHNKLKPDFYNYKKFITQLTPESIKIIVNAYKNNKNLRVQSGEEDTFIPFSFHKLVSFFEAMSIIQDGDNFQDIGAYWLDSISAPCTTATLIEILKLAKIKEQRFIATSFGFHLLMIEIVSDKEFYVYDPNNPDEVKPLVSEKEVADELLECVKEWKNSNEIMFCYDFISFDKDEFFYKLINDHESIINQYQFFQELVIRCQLGLICQKETVLLLIGKAEEFKKTDLSQQLNHFLADLHAYLVHRPSPSFTNLHTIGGGIDVNATIYTKNIHWFYVAAAHGQLSIVKELIKAGANINAKSAKGRTPLFQAANKGHIEVVKLLLGNGANIEATCDGATPLYMAARNGHHEVVDALIRVGANIEATCKGITPLFRAAYNGHVGVVRALISKGADIEAAWNGRTPLLQAAQEGHAGVVSALIAAGADIEATWDGVTPLFKAVSKGYVEVVRILIAAGADIEATCDGATPLFQAAQEGHAGVVSALIAGGADIEATCDGATPLFQAAQEGHAGVVSALIAGGADIEATCDGATPLFQAAQNGHTEVVSALIAAGANIEATWKGATPLFQAAQNGHTEVVSALIAAGANIEATWKGKTPLSQAAQNGHTDIVKILLAQRFKNMTDDNTETILNKFVNNNNNNEKLSSDLMAECLCDHLFEQVNEQKKIDPTSALKILQVATKHDLFKQKGFMSLFSESKSHAILASAQRRFQQLKNEARSNMSNSNLISLNS